MIWSRTCASFFTWNTVWLDPHFKLEFKTCVPPSHTRTHTALASVCINYENEKPIKRLVRSYFHFSKLNPIYIDIYTRLNTHLNSFLMGTNSGEQVTFRGGWWRAHTRSSQTTYQLPKPFKVFACECTRMCECKCMLKWTKIYRTLQSHAASYRKWRIMCH